MQKKNKKVVFAFSLIAIGIIIALYMGHYSQPSFFATIPTGTDIVDSGKQRAGYNCPSTVSYCNVKGAIECNIPGEESKVILRTNADTKLGLLSAYGTGTYSFGNYKDAKWIALTLVPNSGLTAYKFNGLSKGTSGGGCNFFYYHPDWQLKKADGSNFLTPEGFSLWTKDDGTLWMCKVSECHLRECNVFQVDTSGESDITPTSKEPYKSNSQEITSGTTNLYSCSGQFSINDIKKNDLVYSSATIPGRTETAWYKINPNDRTSIVGGDDNYVQYEAINQYETCFADYCQGDTGFITCTNNRPGIFTPCTGILKCSNGKCSPPISSIDLTIKDSAGKEKIGFGINEPINLYLKAVSSYPMTATVYLREGSPQGLSVWHESRQIQSGVQAKFTTSLSELKKYYALIEIDMGLTEKYYYGDDSIEEKYLRISPSISNSVNIKSPTQSRLFINNPVWVEVNVYDANGPAEPDKINLDIKYKNVQVTNLPNYEIPPIVSGNVLTYKYIFQFATPGQLEVTATSERAGISSLPSSFSAKVEDISIITDFTNIGEFRCIPVSSQTLKFESKNSFGEYVDTTNKLYVVEPDTTIPKDISSLVTRTDEGRYTATYSFTKKGATTFKLESFSSEYNLGSSPRSGVIEVKDGCVPDECTQSSDCPTGDICVSGRCVQKDTPWVLYLTIIGAILVGIILIIIVINLSRKKQVNFGGM